jgi:hypothetical protein
MFLNLLRHRELFLVFKKSYFYKMFLDFYGKFFLIFTNISITRCNMLEIIWRGTIIVLHLGWRIFTPTCYVLLRHMVLKRSTVNYLIVTCKPTKPFVRFLT